MNADTINIEAPETEPHVCPPDHPHAKRSTCYRGHRCRCVPCRGREKLRKRAERAAKRSGKTQPMRSPEKTVEHLLYLTGPMGMTKLDISRISGVNVASIRRLIEGEVTQVFPATERAVLSVRADSSTWRDDKSWVSRVGAVRRIQALMALGYSGAVISRRCGRQADWAMRVMNGREKIEERSRVALIRVYDELSMEHPAPDLYVNRTRNMAAKRGYLPPLAWDDIDNDPEPAKLEPRCHRDHLMTGVNLMEASERAKNAGRRRCRACTEETERAKAEGRSFDGHRADEAYVFLIPDDDLFGTVDEIAVERALSGANVKLRYADKRAAVRKAHALRWSDHVTAGRLHTSEQTVFRIRGELGLPAWELADLIHTDAA